MLAPYKQALSKLKIILGSQSPRRQAILKENLGLDFQVMVSGFEEDIDKATCSGPEDYVMKTCRQKNEAILSQLKSSSAGTSAADVVISADTVVVKDMDIMEKPTNAEHAIEMIQSLSGRSHRVCTAVTIAIKNGIFLDGEGGLSNADNDSFRLHTFVESTDVTFATLSSKAIEGYVATGEPLDKAGGYGIQSLGASFVTGVNGCYFNVVGFPVHRFSMELLTCLSK